MPQHAQHATLHHHGYVERVTMSSAMSRSDRLRRMEPDEVMRTPEEVAEWLVSTLRAAMGKPEEDEGFQDERELWLDLARNGESITTGLGDGPTISAEAVWDTDCQCEAPPLVPVTTNKKRR